MAAHPSSHGNKRRQTVAQCRVCCRVINEFASLVCFTVALEIFSAYRLLTAILFFFLCCHFYATFFLYVVLAFVVVVFFFLRDLLSCLVGGNKNAHVSHT